MASLEWRPDLEIGHGQIDADHRSLLEALKRLHQAVEEGRGQAEVAGALSFLRDYTVNHFKTEEAAMIEQRYPGASAHFAEHSKLVMRVSDLLSDVRTGRSVGVDEVKTFLEDWVVNHIQGMDKQFGWFLQRKA